MELRSAENRTDSERRPLAVLFGWLQAKKRHINKYGNLYLSKGFDVVTVQVPPSQVLWPRHTQAKISKLLSLLQVYKNFIRFQQILPFSPQEIKKG